MTILAGETRRRRAACAALVLLIPTFVASFAASPIDAREPTDSSTASTNFLRGEVVVSAAASLSESFTRMGREFRRLHPQVRIRFNFGSTSSLVAQIQGGAPADVFASADLASQDRLAASGNLASSPRVFARNSMQIAVKRGNPLAVRRVADLQRIGVISLCARTAPCGLYASSVLNRNATTISETRITRGADAKATLASVAIGDADAAIVYATDIRAAGAAVEGVVIPPAQNVRTLYAISVVRGARNRTVAQAFVTFVESREGQNILRQFGFLTR